MNVSAASLHMAHTAPVKTQASEGPIEGTKPDGDGDRDDAPKPIGSLGHNINVTA